MPSATALLPPPHPHLLIWLKLATQVCGLHYLKPTPVALSQAHSGGTISSPLACGTFSNPLWWHYLKPTLVALSQAHSGGTISSPLRWHYLQPTPVALSQAHSHVALSQIHLHVALSLIHSSGTNSSPLACGTISSPTPWWSAPMEFSARCAVQHVYLPKRS